MSIYIYTYKYIYIYIYVYIYIYIYYIYIYTSSPKSFGPPSFLFTRKSCPWECAVARQRTRETAERHTSNRSSSASGPTPASTPASSRKSWRAQASEHACEACSKTGSAASGEWQNWATRLCCTCLALRSSGLARLGLCLTAFGFRRHGDARSVPIRAQRPDASR